MSRCMLLEGGYSCSCSRCINPDESAWDQQQQQQHGGCATTLVANASSTDDFVIIANDSCDSFSKKEIEIDSVSSSSFSCPSSAACASEPDASSPLHNNFAVVAGDNDDDHLWLDDEVDVAEQQQQEQPTTVAESWSATDEANTFNPQRNRAYWPSSGDRYTSKMKFRYPDFTPGRYYYDPTPLSYIEAFNQGYHLREQFCFPRYCFRQIPWAKTHPLYWGDTLITVRMALMAHDPVGMRAEWKAYVVRVRRAAAKLRRRRRRRRIPRYSNSKLRMYSRCRRPGHRRATDFFGDAHGLGFVWTGGKDNRGDVKCHRKEHKDAKKKKERDDRLNSADRCKSFCLTDHLRATSRRANESPKAECCRISAMAELLHEDDLARRLDEQEFVREDSSSSSVEEWMEEFILSKTQQ